MTPRRRAILRLCLQAVVISAVLTTWLAASFHVARTRHLRVEHCLLIGGAFALALLWVNDRLTKRGFARRTQTTMRAVRDLKPIPTREEDHPWLDRAELMRWTSDLELLGFSMAADYTLNLNSQDAPHIEKKDSFTRVMIGVQGSCFAEISQSCHAEKRPSEFTCHLRSLYTTNEECSTTTSPLRVKRFDAPFVKYRSNYATHSAADLLREHLARRQEVSAEHGLSFRTDLSYDAYEQQNKQCIEQTLAFMERQLVKHTGKTFDDRV